MLYNNNNANIKINEWNIEWRFSSLASVKRISRQDENHSMENYWKIILALVYELMNLAPCYSMYIWWKNRGHSFVQYWIQNSSWLGKINTRNSFDTVEKLDTRNFRFFLIFLLISWYLAVKLLQVTKASRIVLFGNFIYIFLLYENDVIQ